ncbi:MAG: hypothetical protein CMF96_04985 [Candidatus Marinimicrobia bacterium]|nr:hypothetical protein [Candidatus Neomarinimicrobiota bacterium]
MKKILLISLLSLSFSQELKVEGNLNVTGSMQSTTIDSLKQVIQQLEAQIASMQGGNKLETRVYTTDLLEHGDTLNLFTDLNVPNILSEQSFYLLRVINIEGLGIGPGGFLCGLRQLDQFSRQALIICTADNGCYAPFDESGINIFTSELLEADLISGNMFGTITLAITAQFPSESTVQQNLNKPQAEEIK